MKTKESAARVPLANFNPTGSAVLALTNVERRKCRYISARYRVFSASGRESDADGLRFSFSLSLFRYRGEIHHIKYRATWLLPFALEGHCAKEGWRETGRKIHRENNELETRRRNSIKSRNKNPISTDSSYPFQLKRTRRGQN